VSGWAERFGDIPRNASIPLSSSRACHVYAVSCATPSAVAAYAGVLSARSNRQASNRLCVASPIYLPMQMTANQSSDWITFEDVIGCHEFCKTQ
jgi:hypothetical protein